MNRRPVDDLSVRRTAGVVAGLVAAVLSACSGASKAPRLDSPSGLLGWLATHRDHVGLVVWLDDSAAPAIQLNGQLLFPLASTKKVLILTSYALEVAAGRLTQDERVPLRALDQFYWAGTDGGAHPAAVRDWQQRGQVTPTNDVPLSAVAEAMIRWSDNAAADYLLGRIGGPAAVAATARRLGMIAQQPVAPILGELRSWGSHPTQWLAATPEHRVEMAEAAAASARTPTLPAVAEQRRLAETDAGGTPLEWARAMRQLASGESLPAPAVAIIHRILNWPLTAFPDNRTSFDAYLTKGGSLPGVITEASYIRSRDAARGTAVALFLRNLPANVEASLRDTFEQQNLIRALATDSKFRERAAHLLMSD